MKSKKISKKFEKKGKKSVLTSSLESGIHNLKSFLLKDYCEGLKLLQKTLQTNGYAICGRLEKFALRLQVTMILQLVFFIVL